MQFDGSSSQPLPTGWRWVKLGELCRLTNGDAYKESDWSTQGTPIIRIQNLNDARKGFNYWAGPLNDRVVVEAGDVLLAWSGTPGTSFGAHTWQGERGVLNQHIFLLNLDKSCLDADWAVFAINEQLGEMIGKAHGGVGLRHVTKREVESLRIALPPISEQPRIVALLNHRMKAVDNARVSGEIQLRAAKELAGAHLRAIFGGTEAKQWSKKLLAEISVLLPSKSIATDGDTDVSAITTACLTEIGFNRSGVKHAKMWALDAAQSFVTAGEVLVARSNTPELVGRAALYPGGTEKIVASDLTIRILPNGELLPLFLSSYLSFLYLTGYWKQRAGGASGTMKKITRTQLLNEPVPVPSLTEQQSLTAALTARIEGAQRIQNAIEEQLKFIAAIPAALLRQAYYGEL